MLKNLLNKLKISLKRLLGKSVYVCTYSKDFIKKSFKNKNKSPKNNKLSSLFTNIFKKRKFGFIAVFSIIFIYYGLGIIISSKTNTNLEYKLSAPNNTRYTTNALIYTLKTQVDDTQWTPALPIIFPAYFLDNLPNFQIGTKDAIKHLVKKMSAYYIDSELKKAGELLNYAPNIWLFSKTNDDTIAPGSAKQYRKALALLNSFSIKQSTLYQLDIKELKYFLNSLDSLLDNNIQKLDKHIREHSSDLINHRTDDVFYYTQGNAYVIYYTIKGLTKDYQDQIVEAELYDDITTILKNLETAINFNPISIKNASPEDVYLANHLIYLAYFLSQAQNKLKSVSYNIELKTRELIK